MSKLARIPTQDFDRDVTAVAMDDRFILVGQMDGKLSAVYHKNGVSVFSAKISDSEITAVCCEEQDETDNPIFYAGDVEGNLYTVNKKGKVLKTAKLQARKGKIFTISNRNKYSIYAHTAGGSTSFSHATTDFRKGNFSTASANYSFEETVPSTRRKEQVTTMLSSTMQELQPRLLRPVPWSLVAKSRTLNKCSRMLLLMRSMQT